MQVRIGRCSAEIGSSGSAKLKVNIVRRLEEVRICLPKLKTHLDLHPPIAQTT